MIKKLILVLFVLFCGAAQSAQIVNVEYIHNAIAQKWDITIPYNSELTNPRVAANMKYLLTAIDVANEMLNGGPTTEYGVSAYATTVAADITATNAAVDSLVKKSEYKFFATTTSDTTSFSFDISAAGEFYIDWGDGTTETLSKVAVDTQTISHEYANPGQYNIKLGGRATDYDVDYFVGVISFANNLNLAGISGSLGEIFSTLPNGVRPSFALMFSNCSNLTGQIPSNLFAGIMGRTTVGMFFGTFLYTGLTGPIPENLFGGLNGSVSAQAFFETFAGCTGLTGPIPENLFGGLNGYVDSEAFASTFDGCTGLTSIPENLFGDLDIPINYGAYQFARMFSGCTGLTGPSVRINGQYMYEMFPDIALKSVEDMYSGATGLSDYDNIPEWWGGGRKREIVPAPDDAEYKFTAVTYPDTTYFEFDISAAGEFYIDWGDGITETLSKAAVGTQTISHEYAAAGEYNIRLGGKATEYDVDETPAAIQFNDSITKIDGTLGGIFGTLDDGTQPLFSYAFYGCTGLTSLPENLFTGISGAAVSDMFFQTFAECTGLTSLPENLFSGITTVENTVRVFSGTFMYCIGLTSIPDNLFGGLDANTDLGYFSFEATFADCISLTGPSVRINGRYLYEIWPDALDYAFYGMYSNCEGLEDWDNVPDVCKGDY